MKKRRIDFELRELELEVNSLYKFVLDIEKEQAQVRKEIADRERDRRKKRKNA